MEFFNYVMVLASVIVGLAVTHLLQGVAKMIQHPDRKQLYWVHLAWVALMFLNVLFVWWWEFQLAGVRTFPGIWTTRTKFRPLTSTPRIVPWSKW